MSKGWSILKNQRRIERNPESEAIAFHNNLSAYIEDTRQNKSALYPEVVYEEVIDE